VGRPKGGVRRARRGRGRRHRNVDGEPCAMRSAAGRGRGEQVEGGGVATLRQAAGACEHGRESFCGKARQQTH